MDLNLLDLQLDLELELPLGLEELEVL